MTDSEDKKYRAIPKSKFTEVIRRGDRIVNGLIKKGILKEVSPTEVCLTSSAPLLTETPVRNVAQGEMSEIWSLLWQSLNTCANCKHVHWLIALGFGLRCGKEENRYKALRTDCERDTSDNSLGPLVPSRFFTCEYFEKKEYKEKQNEETK
jgi:hypothetical protein